MYSNYHIKQLNKDRLKDLAILHLAVYQREVPADFFEKKYATAYTGREYIGYIAYADDDIPVGYYGVIPCFLNYGGEKLLSAQSADTMTHPGYRFKGLFVELASLCYALCREQGIQLIFGFPNQNSYHGAVNKLGWQIAGQMDCFTVRVKAISFGTTVQRVGFLRSLYGNYVNWIVKRYTTTDYPDSLVEQGYDGVHRDEDYQHYKTYYHHHLLKLDNVVYWVKLQQGLVIGDIALRDEKDFDNAINGIRRIAATLGLQKIQFHISQGTVVHRLFAERFKPVPTFPVLFRDLGFGKTLERFRFSFGDIDIF